MNKILKSIVFLIIPVTSFCSERDSIKSDRFQLGGIYSPEVGYRTLKTDREHSWLKEGQDNMDVPKFGYSAGIHFGCKLYTKLSLEVQALYSDKGSRTKESVIENKAAVDYLEKIAYKGSVISNYRYLDFPVKLNYFLCTGKVKLFVTAGVSINAFLNKQTLSFIQYQDGSNKTFNSTSTTEANKINVAALLGFGLNYNLSDHYIFRLEPVFKHSLTPLANTPVKTYLYTAGIQMGIQYTF
jgi:hypothetical protein